MQKIDFNDMAYEIWATAQLMPGEGIEDGVQRVFNLLADNFNPTKHKQLGHPLRRGKTQSLLESLVGKL